MLDALARHALPFAGTHALSKGIHAIENLVNVGNAILAINDNLALVDNRTAQSRVQNSTILSGVDVLAGIHGVAALFQTNSTTKRAEQPYRLIVNKVFGEIKMQIGHVKRELVYTIWIRGKPFFETNSFILKLVVMRLERSPFRRFCGIYRCRNL